MSYSEQADKKASVPTSIRISGTCQRLSDALAKRDGLTRTGYLERMMREQARAAGISIDADETDGKKPAE